MANKLKLTRNQLAQFLSDHESIKQFEALFSIVDALAPDFVNEVFIAAENAGSRATQALDALQRLSNALELLALAPQKEQDVTLALDYLDMRGNAPHVTLPRRLAWNDGDGTLDIGMGYDGVVQQVGLETYYRIKASAAISDGDLVQFDGAVGASGVIKGKPTTAGLTEGLRVLGVATMDIPNNDFGYVTAFGLVRGINTTGTPVGEVWADGDILYYNPALVGKMTHARPVAPNEVVIVAAVISAGSGGSGSLFIRPTFYPKLIELSDVYAPAATDRQPLRYNTATARWESASDLYLNEIVMDKTAGRAIKIDHAAPNYGWNDWLGEIVTRGVGATDPGWALYRNGIYAYQFAVNDECWQNFHVLHDYAPGTDLYIHAHWSHNAAAVTLGSITWTFEITYAKGHNQAAFPATKTISITQNASTTQYQHMLAEVQFTNAGGDATHIDRALIEVDGIIMVRCYLSANSMNGGAVPFLHFIDIHYQSTGITTKNKAPNFYA